MGSVPPATSMWANDAAYPRIRAVEFNAHWPASETPFDRATGEFSKWSNKLEIFLQQTGLNRYIFAPDTKPERLITQPDPNTEPVAYSNWLSNNDLIIGVIRAAVSDAEQEGLNTGGTAKECYDALKARAQSQGPVKQVALIREALSTYASVSEPIDTTARRICELIDRAFAIGTVDKDLLKCIALLRNVDDESFESIQAQMSRGLADSTSARGFNTMDIQFVLEILEITRTNSHYVRRNTTPP